VETIDWVALGVVTLTALVGLRKGLLGSAISLAAVVVGVVLGARLAPHLLPDGSHSPYAPLVALAGAVVLAGMLETAASVAGAGVRAGVRLSPLRSLDSLGGLVLGAAAGLAVVWVAGAAALLYPGQDELRRSVQRSAVFERLNELVPPRRLLDLLARVDPFPAIVGPALPTDLPSSALLDDPEIRAAADSVVHVLGTACGLGVSGSGWVAAPGVVVTAAHVVAGETDTIVLDTATGIRFDAQAVAFDPRNDLAVLRVPGLEARPLAAVDPEPGRAAAIVGYPENGPLAAVPARIGTTATILTEDAYGRRPVSRSVTAVGGLVRPGNSGGPAIDADGRVEATIFASRVGAPGGYGVPSGIVRDLLGEATGPVSTGDCAR
jgi:S1-C subfamily serine protease